jgi:flavin reductase (DIM6/NTAB) family NADH-FMN oxidoreductase RutF
MSATAVCELSLDPPSMIVCVNRSASLYSFLEGGAPFAINILHFSQAALASRCGGQVKGEERFAEGDWCPAASGVPLLADAQASIVCSNAGHFEHGTHAVFIGNVEEVFLSGDPGPLVYLDGRFTRAHDGADTV